MRRLPAVLCALFSLCLIAARQRSVRSTTPIPTLNLQRSFAISDKAILDAFTFERVLAALADRSSVPGMTAEKLFRQWFDIQNPKPGLDASMPHCDDETTNGNATMNGFRIACPADGGPFATAPFQPDSFLPILITNRFDQATGANCGQYRIVFAQKRGAPAETFHIIFEAALPNPDPSGNLAACRPVAQFWADLSAISSMDERRARLERFFFDGIDGFEPAIHPDHYSVAPAGIRTLQFTLPANLVHFYQYRLIHTCSKTVGCKLFMKPDLIQNNTFGPLFDARTATPAAAAFRDDFLKQVATLVIRDVNLYSMAISDRFLIPDTQPAGDEVTPSPTIAFDDALTSPQGQLFGQAIRDEASKAGSAIDPSTVVLRAQTQSCAGCHFGGVQVGEGVNFPLALRDFQHVTEDALSAGEAGPGTRYQISQAMLNVFIPHRMQILRDFLATGKAPVHSN